ncbi:LacI family DNA-binding transcriptional regulator [Actinophytocola glycyrrhizae]|uniref:LacI family DNA-binding transcriptional regulator n=1 Tax=Actinophytocola glycyrrhizae TaxID=2044873 RepID=A0ABV9SBG3_9PSEU
MVGYKEVVPRRPMTRRVTLEEVARAAGVSRATVSRVVNGVASVDENIRHAVEEAISDTGYLPNLAARSLVTRRADAVALVLPDEDRVLGDPFFGRVVRGVMTVTAPAGLHLVLTTTGVGTGEQVVSDLSRGRLDGVILIHTSRNDPLPGRLVDGHHPVVLSARPPSPLPITYVDVHQISGAALAAQHLRHVGRTRLATIAGPQDTPAGQDRLRGFLAAAGTGTPWADGDFTMAGGETAMTRLLADHPGVDGVFVASDLMARGALPVLRRAGRRVPEDVAVVGFDDSSAALDCDPPLTTVRQPTEDMAAEMARLLVRQIEHPDTPVAAVIFQPTLVVRHST